MLQNYQIPCPSNLILVSQPRYNCEDCIGWWTISVLRLNPNFRNISFFETFAYKLLLKDPGPPRWKLFCKWRYYKYNRTPQWSNLLGVVGVWEGWGRWDSPPNQMIMGHINREVNSLIFVSTPTWFAGWSCQFLQADNHLSICQA